MFYNLRRFINQNRRDLLIIAGIIVLVIVVIRTANSLVAREAERTNQNTENTVASQEGSRSPNILHTDSIISGDELNESTASENQDVINNFIQACNNGDINLAYSYLSNSCKNKMFSTVDEFTTKYYEPIFQTPKEYNIENWISGGEVYTYRIYYVDDILSSRNYFR